MLAVDLIVTGDMEHQGLAAALAPVFPGAEFSAQKVDCFTSNKVSWPPPKAAGVKSAIEKYAAALVNAVDPGRKKRKPDFVIGIEDLELANKGQPESVISGLRSAVIAELENERKRRNAASFAKLRESIRRKCSFHLFAPMPEAYFFADPAALAATGCKREPVLIPARDLEDFETNDAAYLSVSKPPSPWACARELLPFHPKHYLQFLVYPELYSETHQGVKGLLALDWRKVLGWGRADVISSCHVSGPGVRTWSRNGRVSREASPFDPRFR